MTKELSPADRCRKNNWYVGCTLKATGKVDNFEEYWKITAIGEFLVLGKRVNLPHKTTSGEEVMDLNSSWVNWRISTLKKV